MSINTSSSNSDLSLDSLEVDWKRNIATKNLQNTNGDTILVPFYDKDVLVKIEKPQMKVNRKQTKAERHNKKEETTRSYLVNRNTERSRIPSYLEAFRRKFPMDFPNKQKNVEEIRSISPEFGDTERESISDSETSPRKDFYETEAYNNIYYEQLMNQEITDDFNKKSEFQPTEDNNSFDEYIINNLKSISELTQPRRRPRRASVEPIHNIHLGGLGPDLENIKPRLERAKSLQRYSEKVRMKNRLKIYKKPIQDVNKPKNDWTDANVQKENEPSYLVNKSDRRKCKNKSKPAKPHNGRTGQIESNKNDKLRQDQKKDFLVCGTSALKKVKTNLETKESKKKHDKDESVLDTNDSEKIPNPNFNALRSLEEKHRMYQERVKQFQMV